MPMTREDCGPRERGDTLVELLITVVILGVTVAGIIGALGNITLASDIHRRSANADTVLRSYSAYVLSRPYDASCGATAYDAGFVVSPQAAGYAPSITAVRYWTGAAPVDAASSFANTCSAGVDKGLQMVTVQVVAPGGRVTEKATLFIRAA